MQQTVQVAEEIRKAAMAANIPNAHGHDLTAPRLLISPIPTTDWNDNMIRRVIVSSTDAALATSAAQKLAGVPIGAGYLIPAEHDAVFAQFTGISKRWKTVTPVLQSGYHNGDARKKAHVYSKMFEHAGLAQPIRCVETFGDVAFKVSAKHGHDRLPRVHMLIEFGENVTGVVALGTGRFSGLGLFAAL
jgi:CRISPR-associated protein Csb2